MERQGQRWTSDEDSELERLWPLYDLADVAVRMKRSEGACRSRAGVIGLPGQIQPRIGPRATRLRVLAHVRGYTVSTVRDIADSLRVRPALVHSHLMNLCAEGRVRRAGTEPKTPGRGRPSILWEAT